VRAAFVRTVADGIFQLASWLPFDAVCQAILDVAFAPVTPERALNLVHPRPIAWEKIMVALSQSLETLGIHERLALVDLQTWFAKLNEASRGADDATLRRIVRGTPLQHMRYADARVPACHQTTGLLRGHSVRGSSHACNDGLVPRRGGRLDHARHGACTGGE
jgi:hypothetical protein